VEKPTQAVAVVAAQLEGVAHLVAGRAGAFDGLDCRHHPIANAGILCHPDPSCLFGPAPTIAALASLANQSIIKAPNGENGRGQLTDGKNGKDVIVRVPTNTRVVTIETGEVREITKVGERLLIAEGGRPGRGNDAFRSSTNTTPREFEDGKAGEEVTLRLELRLIASVGLVGLPNAGKSSLLNALTAAKSKVGSYPFTTLEPSLGSYYGLIVADIPGLIEGAAVGKGLGVKFLKHIERTKTLFHLVSAESDDVVRDYTIVRKELGQYSPELVEKQEYVLLSHADMVEPHELQEKLTQLKKVSKSVTPLSVIDDVTLVEVKKILNELKDAEGIGDA
ncbi:MAG: Obg family GTPase CgtA, partial [Candidatus Andersenbacteria bacterium]|nr:Obg family GTPase CgtA [Candidatus Andersenbacteria bacterium]